MDKLFPLVWEGSIDHKLGWLIELGVVVFVNCLILAMYVFTACFIVWLWFGGAL